MNQQHFSSKHCTSFPGYRGGIGSRRSRSSARALFGVALVSLLAASCDSRSSGSAGTGQATLRVTPGEAFQSAGPEGGPFFPSEKIYFVDNTGTKSLSWSLSTPTGITASPRAGVLQPGDGILVEVRLDDVVADGLPPQAYNSTLVFTNESNGPGSASLLATLVVNPRGALAVTPEIGFTASGLQGGPFAPFSQSYSLNNTKSESLDWQAESSAPWLVPSTSSGSLPPGGVVVVTAAIDAGQAGTLPPGSHMATLTVRDPSESEETVLLVCLDVLQGPSLVLEPAQDFLPRGPAGGPFVPPSMNYTLRNPGQGPLAWQGASSQPWVLLSSSGGSLNAGQSVQLSVAIDAAGTSAMTPGDQGATITFTNTTNGQGSITTDVVLTIEPTGPVAPEAGLFLSLDDLLRTKSRIAAGLEPFDSGYDAQRSRAVGNLSASADPFTIANVSTITYAWCGSSNNGVDDSLRDAVNHFEHGSDVYRCLALEFALSGEAAFGDKALSMMLTWAQQHTPVNLYDLNVDFQNASMDGLTSGSCSNRPWDFGLNGLFQAYGLINSCDAYLLLTRNGQPISGAQDALLRGWLLEVAEAVNSSFHCWTKWADLHPNSSAFERYRADNHLSWAMAGLMAAGVALGDDALVSYVLDGGTWTDRKAGAYANPSSIEDVIDLAIESGTGAANEGRVYEEKILRDPPIGYALYHLWAMALIARMAQVHEGRDLWAFRGADGAGLELAFDRYGDYVLGNKTSPAPQQEGDLTFYAWEYELTYARWRKAGHADVIETTDRLDYRLQAIGPVSLVVGEILP